MKMRYKAVFEKIQNLTNDIVLTHKEISEILISNGINVTANSLRNRMFKDGYLKDNEIEVLYKHFNIVDENIIYSSAPALTNINNTNGTKTVERYEIPYWEGLNDDLKLTDLLTSKWEDVETIVNLWGRKPENLRVIAMYGNAMEGYWYRLNNRDLLLMDISSTDLTKSGVYLFTTDNGKNIFIRELAKLYDGSVIAKRYEPNSQVFERKITKEDMEELDFKVIGRIFKNINFTL